MRHHLNLWEQLSYIRKESSTLLWRLRVALHLLFCRNCRESLEDTRRNCDMLVSISDSYKEREKLEFEIKTQSSR